ncbi:MAG: helicase HerA-like domain-containing protein [Methylohalobius sp. ZOD2]
MDDNRILLGGNGRSRVFLDLATANRHGLISGATGTGKTVSLQVLAEGFSRAGVPVFLADVKGDLSGIAAAGELSGKIRARIERIGIDDFAPRAFPTLFWDVFGRCGHPVRVSVSELGPLLLSTLLELNETQTGVIYSAFKIADEEGLLLLDLKDLQSLLGWMRENRKELEGFGYLSPASLGAIQRRLLVLEEQGADRFFGEPALRLDDLMHADFFGHGAVSILDARALIQSSPGLYAALLLWLLAELFETLPEVGDLEQPKLVLFFDEAHLLFKRAPKALLDTIEQVVRLIRSKGVGVFFITQSPLDLPDPVLGQLGCRIQHALRAFTPRDRQAVRVVAQTFRSNPAIDAEREISELGIGEALVSVLDEKGTPTPVERILIRPPRSRIGPVEETVRNDRIERSPLQGRYEATVDRESAHELLQQRAAHSVAVEPKPRRSGRQGVGEAFLKSAARSIGSQIGRQLIRGIMGALLSRR